MDAWLAEMKDSRKEMTACQEGLSRKDGGKSRGNEVRGDA
jgi:hypothetical protein